MKKKTILSAVILSAMVGALSFSSEAMNVEENSQRTGVAPAAAAAATGSRSEAASDEVMTTSDIREAIALARAGRRVALTVAVSRKDRDTYEFLEFSSNANRHFIDLER